ncbi:MAG: hypothetical protein RMJ38_06620 [candidate division WOR-3 bacterium]|nr:hypothetical protein [candidate division WOR-3 bacterium]MDW8151095.1 hypothetical protein [candidate division WOR-3 bacterium]
MIFLLISNSTYPPDSYCGDPPSNRYCTKMSYITNDAGLVMTTINIIKPTGGEPINFLDVGGVKVEQIANAFRIIMIDSNVKMAFINFFGGILRSQERNKHGRRHKVSCGAWA